MRRRGRPGLSTAAVVDAALEVIDEGGVEALTLAAVAARTGVAPPSLYKHVRNLAELRQLVAQRVLGDMTGLLGAAVMGRSGDDAVAALLHTWRAYVVEHPGRYAAVPLDPLRDPVLAPAGTRLMDVILAVLRGYGLADDEAIHATRRLRAAAHGFATLEAAGGFGMDVDVDESYARLVDMAVASLAPTPATRPTVTDGGRGSAGSWR